MNCHTPHRLPGHHRFLSLFQHVLVRKRLAGGPDSLIGDRVRAAFSATRSVAGSYEIDFRICLRDEVRWISARGQGADVGMVDRAMFGIFLDVTGRKQAEEGSELLAGEMSHRVKNLLAIATGLTQITGRSARTVEAMTRDLTQRLTSLGRAHDLVRPLPGEQGKAALLGDLISVRMRQDRLAA